MPTCTFFLTVIAYVTSTQKPPLSTVYLFPHLAYVGSILWAVLLCPAFLSLLGVPQFTLMNSLPWWWWDCQSSCAYCVATAPFIPLFSLWWTCGWSQVVVVWEVLLWRGLWWAYQLFILTPGRRVMRMKGSRPPSTIFWVLSQTERCETLSWTNHSQEQKYT